MKRTILLLFFLMFTIIFYSQKVTLSGTVKDSLQNSMPYANVIAKPKDVSKNLQFAITDNEGYYKLLLQKGDSITISISYLGYKPIDYEFVARRDGDTDSSWADATRAKKLLHWKPIYNIDQMCEDTWRWQKNNPDGYKL